MKANGQDSGIVLVTVLCFTAIMAILAAGLFSESMTQIRIARRQIGMEQAFYVAEGGAERAVSYICGGGPVPGTITGTIGDGHYTATILGVETLGGVAQSVSGEININPNNSPHNSFLLVTADGSVITREDLHQDKSDQTGTAILVHVQPKGPGSQNNLIVDGVAYTLQNNKAYTISSAGMSFNLYNKNRNPQGKAVGQWWIELDGVSAAVSDDSDASGAEMRYSIFSLGVVDGAKRIVLLEGLHQKSWAKYALWYGADQWGCWFIAGEKFYGPVHANVQVNFRDDPEFFEPLTSAHHTYGGNTNQVTFHKGFQLNAPFGSMASINFNDLRSKASLVLTGETSVALAGTNLVMSNSRAGWADETMELPHNGLVYVETASSGAGADGIASVGGTLDGRLTIVAQHDIRITNHVIYATHPTNNSSDALGLIAGRDVRIETGAPNDLDIHAHIMATGNDTASTTDGMFYVHQFNSGSPRGALTVHGGIAQYTRGPVGTFSSWTGNMLSGYSKDYTFDTRFATHPPPHYPTITNEYTWTSWREMAP